MVEKLFILVLWPEHYLPTLLNLIMFILTCLAFVGASRRRNSAAKWLLPLSAGFLLEALPSIVRITYEVVSDRSHLPSWIRTYGYDGYFLGQLCLIMGLFLLWRSVSHKQEAETREASEQETSNLASWPPAPKP